MTRGQLKSCIACCVIGCFALCSMLKDDTTSTA